MSEYRFPMEICQVIRAALPENAATFSEPPDLRYTFTPPGHARALRPDTLLVEGNRGTGKSLWWAVLQSEPHRKMVAHALPKTGLDPDIKVSTGFGAGSSPGNYPAKDTLIRLTQSFDPRRIWRTIMIKQTASGSAGYGIDPTWNWEDAVKWVTDNPERVDRLLFESDRELDREEKHHLVLFDALDRAADDWPNMIEIIRGLLQVLLEFKSYRRIRPKVFLRPDHLKDPKAAGFPDASKVLNGKVELRWPAIELYGLLWQYLANEPGGGDIFRTACEKITGERWEQYEDVWTVPDRMRIQEETQRRVFHAMTGPWMGRDRRRGSPYTWLPNHLGDAGGQVSPRSFLAAIRHAAMDDRRPDYRYPIYYESIKRGVQEASRIRVREMEEDYPWVSLLMKPLEGLTVPCDFEEIAERWESRNTLARLKKEIQEDDAAVKLPPKRLDEGPEGVGADLERLGVFARMRDGRVNLPDVYRVGYGLTRKGGVKAIARK